MNLSNTKTIVFITGAFVSHSCWDEWAVFFENKGYKTVAPPWLHKNESAEVLRSRHPDEKVASIRLQNLIDYYTEIIEKLPNKPILIGHSYGGLLTQLLLQKDLAVSGVAIHSVAPQGLITFKYSFYKGTWGALGFFTSLKKTFLMPFKQWQYAFTNGMLFEEQKEAYEKLVIPESKLALRDGLTKTAKIDFKKPHPPLLLIAGSEDHIVPSSLNYSNFKKYKNFNSITTFREFKGRNHFVLGQSNWMEVASFTANWLEKVN